MVVSLAGATRSAHEGLGEVRVGGFGGVPGLIGYLRSAQVDLVVDATHPFAIQMSAHAATACTASGVPLLRLSRPGWESHPAAGTWQWVDSLPDARAVAEGLGERIFLSIGRQELAEFSAWTHRYVLARVIDPPDFTVPQAWEMIRGRGPFALDDERELLRSRRIEALVTKNSGGELAAAKLTAAASLGVPVVIVRRPISAASVPTVSTVDEAADWVQQHWRR